MSEIIDASTRNAMALAIKTSLDAGGASGDVQLWNGAVPVVTTDVPSGALMATIGLAYPCGTVADGILTLTPTTGDPSVAVSGSPTFARFRSASGTVVLIREIMLAADYDALSIDEQTALGPVIRLNYALAAGTPINFAGTLAIVIQGG